MTTVYRLPTPNASRSRHPAYSQRLANVESRKRLRLTDRAHRLGVVLLAGGTGGSISITLTASVYPHPAALVCAVVALVGSVLYVGGGR